VDSLSLHQLKSITKSDISVIFLQSDQVHYISETRILKGSLGLASDTERKTKVGHHCACII
jgi:hypothetical protein